MPTPCPRVERGKQFVLCQYIGISERVHERAFAGVGIADQRDGHHAASRFDLAFFSFFDLLQVGLEIVDSFFDQPAIDFQLLLTRTTHTDAHFQTRKVSPHVFQTRQRIFKLSKLDGQTRFVSLCSRGKDVENQFGSIQDFDF